MPASESQQLTRPLSRLEHLPLPALERVLEYAALETSPGRRRAAQLMLVSRACVDAGRRAVVRDVGYLEERQVLALRGHLLAHPYLAFHIRHIVLVVAKSASIASTNFVGILTRPLRLHSLKLVVNQEQLVALAYAAAESPTSMIVRDLTLGVRALHRELVMGISDVSLAATGEAYRRWMTIVGGQVVRFEIETDVPRTTTVFVTPPSSLHRLRELIPCDLQALEIGHAIGAASGPITLRGGLSDRLLTLPSIEWRKIQAAEIVVSIDKITAVGWARLAGLRRLTVIEDAAPVNAISSVAALPASIQDLHIVLEPFNTPTDDLPNISYCRAVSERMDVDGDWLPQLSRLTITARWDHQLGPFRVRLWQACRRRNIDFVLKPDERQD